MTYPLDAHRSRAGRVPVFKSPPRHRATAGQRLAARLAVILGRRVRPAEPAEFERAADLAARLRAPIVRDLTAHSEES